MKNRRGIKLLYYGFHRDGGISRDFNSIWESRKYSRFNIDRISYNEKRIEKSRFFAYFFTWLRLLIQRDRSLILSAVFYPEGLIAWLAGRNQVIFLHGTEIPKRGLRKFIFNTVINSANRVIANSTYTKDVAKKALKKNRNIDIVYPITTFGAEEAKYVTEKSNKSPVRKHSLKLLTVSRLVSHKNHELVVNVVNRLIKEGQNIKYSIVGKGGNELKLKEQVKQLNLEKNITFHGYVSENELKLLYKSADLFVMPSKKIANSFEGFGLVFVEAKAFGVPSIGSKIGGISDAIKDRHDGFLINPDSEEELNDLLHSLCVDNTMLIKLKKEAQKRYYEAYNPKKLMQELDCVLNANINSVK